MWDLSSPSRDQIRVPCIARQILNHWTTREVPSYDLFYPHMSDQRCLYEALESFKRSKSPEKTYVCTTCPAFCPQIHARILLPFLTNLQCFLKTEGWHIFPSLILSTGICWTSSLGGEDRGISGGKTIRNISFVLVRYRRVCFLSFSFVLFAFLVPSATEFTNDTHTPCPQLQKYPEHIYTYIHMHIHTYTRTSTHIHTPHRNLAGVSTAC